MEKRMKLKSEVNTQFLVDIGVLNQSFEIKKFEMFMDIFNNPIYLKGWKDVPENLKNDVDYIMDFYTSHFESFSGTNDFLTENGLPNNGLNRDYIFRVYSSQILNYIAINENNNITFDEWKYLLKHSSDLETFLKNNYGLTSEQKKELIEYCIIENPLSVRFLDENKSCYKMLCQMAVMTDYKAIKYINTTDDDFYYELVIKSCIYHNECRSLEILNRPINNDVFSRICRLSGKHFKNAMNRLSESYKSDITIEEFENYHKNDYSVTNHLYRCTSIPIEYRQLKSKEYLEQFPKMLEWFASKGMVEDFDAKVKYQIANNIPNDNLNRLIKAKLIEQGKHDNS